MVLVHVGYLVLPVFGSVRNRGMVLVFISIQNMCPVYLNIHCSCLLASASLARVSQFQITGHFSRKTFPQRDSVFICAHRRRIYTKRIITISRLNSDESRTNGAGKDKLAASLARAMSWKGNICHKGLHTRRACGRAAFLHIITGFLHTPDGQSSSCVQPFEN